MVRASNWFALFVFAVLSAVSSAQSWSIYKPGNTGIGGNQVESLALDPTGRPWVGARYPVQQDGGVAMFDGTKWTNYSNVDGLMPSEFVYATAFAADGSRWHGTDVGLVHHFGDHYQLFNSSNTPLPRNFIRSVRIDSSGAVWMVYWEPGYIFTGVARFDGTNWTVWPHNTSMGLGNAIQLDKIVIDSTGKAWVGNNSTVGISKWDGTKWVRVLPGTGATGPFNPFLGRDGRLWVMCGSDIRVLDNGQWLVKPYPNLEEEWISLHVLPNGTYYVGSWGGVLAQNTGQGWQTLRTPGAVAAIETNTQGELWWTSLKRLYKFLDWSSWRAYHSGNTGLNEYFTNTLEFDSTGRVWIGTSGGGACSFDGSVWRGYNPYNDGFEPWNLPTDYVTDLLSASDGSIWAALSGGAARFDGTSWTLFSRGFTMDQVSQGPDGKIYSTWDINTDNGYSVFNGVDFLRTSLAGAPTYSGQPHDILVDSAGIYLATFTGLLTNETGTWVRKEFDTLTGGMPTQALCVAKSPNGDLWVGTGLGLARRHNGNWTMWTTSNSGIPANTITGLDVRSDGLLAVGAFNGSLWPYFGGVSLWNGSTWRKFTYGNSPIQHEQVDDVAFDADGNLWIVSQSEGIAKIDLASGGGAPELSQISLKPSQMAGGLSTTGTVTLAGPAPVGGTIVGLASDSSLASVPATVTVPAGAKTISFKVATKVVASDTTVTISATLGTTTRSTPLLLQYNLAGYYGDSVPMQLEPGQVLDVSVTYRNMGSSTWYANTVKLTSMSPRGNTIWGTSRLTLNPLLSVKPGELGNFMGTITAPTTPGTYVFQWQPFQPGGGVFPELAPKVEITVADSSNQAGFESQTVPTTVKAGATFGASIVMRNTGTATWTAADGYGMVTVGDPVWGRGKIGMPTTASVPPDATYAFRAQFRAPATPGTFNFRWRMSQTGQGEFGDPTATVSITVTP